MRNFWLVAKREYRSVVVRRGFVILTAAIPLGLALLVGLGFLIETLDDNQSRLPVGYVDQAGFLDAGRQAALPTVTQASGLPGDTLRERVEVRAFPDQEAALAALEKEEIQAFFVFPADYRQTLHTEIYYLEKPLGDKAWGDFDDWVRANLVASYPAQAQARLLEGTHITVHDIVGKRTFSEASIANIVLPFVATFFFFFATMSAAGYMLGVVAGEKENRTMEILVTSVTPGQLIGGKAAGLLAASLTQLAIYTIAAVIGLKVAAPYIPELQQVVVPWGYLGMVALFFLPAYGLVAAIMIALGSVVTDVQQGQQIAGLLNLIFMLPILLLVVFFEDPGGPLVILMTLFPATAFLTISLRWGLGAVPLWQIGASWLLLVATMGFVLWAAARIFRAGMLRYGQPMNWKAVVAAVKGY